jgi:hypothetical protein
MDCIAHPHTHSPRLPPPCHQQSPCTYGPPTQSKRKAARSYPCGLSLSYPARIRTWTKRAKSKTSLVQPSTVHPETSILSALAADALSRVSTGIQGCFCRQSHRCPTATVIQRRLTAAAKSTAAEGELQPARFAIAARRGGICDRDGRAHSPRGAAPRDRPARAAPDQGIAPVTAARCPVGPPADLPARCPRAAERTREAGIE